MPRDQEKMESIIRADGRYPLEAFAFLHEGLTKAVSETHGENPPEDSSRHVSGEQMCLALRNVAVDRWGFLAQTVLFHWNIRKTIDFGEMVYLLIEHEMMKKTEADSIEDFREVFNFSDVFKKIGRFDIPQ